MTPAALYNCMYVSVHPAGCGWSWHLSPGPPLYSGWLLLHTWVLCVEHEVTAARANTCARLSQETEPDSEGPAHGTLLLHPVRGVDGWRELRTETPLPHHPKTLTEAGRWGRVEKRR